MLKIEYIRKLVKNQIKNYDDSVQKEIDRYFKEIFSK